MAAAEVLFRGGSRCHLFKWVMARTNGERTRSEESLLVCKPPIPLLITNHVICRRESVPLPLSAAEALYSASHHYYSLKNETTQHSTRGRVENKQCTLWVGA